MLAIKRGYESQVHKVVTSDGYILEMHRITGSPLRPPRIGKKVVFLQHGFLDSSATWVMSGKDHGLGKYFVFVFLFVFGTGIKSRYFFNSISIGRSRL